VNYDSVETNVHNFNDSLKPPGTFKGDKYWDLVPTWRAEADYDLTRDNMVYASFSRGYKPGSLNAPGGVLTTRSFAPETNTAFELGSKNQFLDRHLRLNAAAFYYVYKNMQYDAVDPKEFAGGIENIPSTHIYGAEAEASYTGGKEDRLHVDASLSLEDGEIEGTYYALDSTIQQQIIATAAPCKNGGVFFSKACWAAEMAAMRNVAGNAPAKMPNILGSLSVSYDFSIPDGYVIPAGMLTPRVDLIYRGTFWQRIFAEPGFDRVPDYALVNLNFEYIPTDSNLTVQLSITNLFEVAGVNSRYTDPFGTFTTSQQFIPPRQIMGTIGYSF
jgi:iron complex outermembrane receptor protein